MQQALERGQQDHEQRAALTLGQLPQLPAEQRRQVDGQTCASETLPRRTRTVSRQFQQRLLTAEYAGPVIELALTLAGLHPLALPQRIIGVLNRQLSQLDRLALAIRGITLNQFLHQQLHRPAIGDDVMLGQHQHMFFARHLQQTDAQQRAVLQIERLTDLTLHIRLSLLGRLV